MRKSIAQLRILCLLLLSIVEPVRQSVAEGVGPPILLKSEIAKYGKCCGPIAAYYSLRYCGMKVNFDDLVVECGDLQEKGVSLGKLAEVLRGSGVQAEPVRLTPSQFAEIRYPFIAVLKSTAAVEQHYVFVAGITQENNVLVLDRTLFTGEVPMSAFLDMWIGTGILVLPQADRMYLLSRSTLPWLLALVLVEIVFLFYLRFGKHLLRYFCIAVGIQVFFLNPYFGRGRAYATPLDLGETSGKWICVDAEKVDLGKHIAGTILSHRFTLSNIGSEVCSLSIVKRSCVCATAELTCNTLLPGATTCLDVFIDTRGKKGKESAIVDLKTSYVAQPHFMVGLNYTAGEVFSVSPRSMDLGGIPMEKSTVRYLKVTFDGDYRISNLISTGTVPWITTALVASTDAPTLIPEDFFIRNDSEKTLYVQVSLQPPIVNPLMEITENLIITTEGNDFFQYEIPIKGFLRGRSGFSSRRVSIAGRTKTGHASAQVTINPHDSNSVDRVEILSVPDVVRCRVETKTIPQQYVLSFDVDEDLPSGKYTGEVHLRITYKDAFIEEVLLPLFILLS